MLLRGKLVATRHVVGPIQTSKLTGAAKFWPAAGCRYRIT
jgi:hypothetical protein